MARRKRTLEVVRSDDDGEGRPSRRNRLNFFELAYQKIEELLYELRSELTIVIVTHNMQQAARVSDYTAFFYLGRLVEVNETRRLFTTPREERTEAYITGRFG